MGTIKVKHAGTKVAAKKNVPERTLDMDIPGALPETAAARLPSDKEEITAYDTTDGQEPQLVNTARLFTESPHSSDESIIHKLTSKDNEWATVPKKQRRAHSLDSAENSRPKNKNKFDVLTTEHVTATGENAETEDEQPGPSVPKGKQIDPREWGNIKLSNDEIDIDAQAAAIKAYNKALKNKHNKLKKYSKKSAKKYPKDEYNELEAKADFDLPQVNRHQSVPTAGHASVPVNMRAGSRPAAQIAPKSSLGVALTGIAKGQWISKVKGIPPLHHLLRTQTTQTTQNYRSALIGSYAELGN